MFDEAEWWVYLMVSRKGPMTFYDEGAGRGVELDARRHAFRVLPQPRL